MSDATAWLVPPGATPASETCTYNTGSVGVGANEAQRRLDRQEDLTGECAIRSVWCDAGWDKATELPAGCAILGFFTTRRTAGVLRRGPPAVRVLRGEGGQLVKKPSY